MAKAHAVLTVDDGLGNELGLSPEMVISSRAGCTAEGRAKSLLCRTGNRLLRAVALPSGSGVFAPLCLDLAFSDCSVL